MKKLIAACVIGTALVGGGLAAADQKPKVDVSAKKHPNLEAAQVAIGDAWSKLTRAQEAHEFDLDGHAQKAKDALDTANKEIKLAAETANKK
jgi:hypothetical protein